MVKLQNAGREIHGYAAAEHAKNIEDLLDVGDLRNTDEPQWLVGQKGGAKNGQDGVLVGGRSDFTAQWNAAVDDQIGHVWVPGVGEQGAYDATACNVCLHRTVNFDV